MGAPRTLQYCECCKNIAFPKRANQRYCKNCGRFIHALVNKINSSYYIKIRALKKKNKWDKLLRW